MRSTKTIHVISAHAEGEVAFSLGLSVEVRAEDSKAGFARAHLGRTPSGDPDAC